MRENSNKENTKLIAQALNFKQQGSLINAEYNLKKVLKDEPGNFIALNNLGSIYLAKNDLKKAKKFFSKAIDIKKDYSTAMFNLAKINDEMGKKNEAIRLYKNAIKHDPNNLGFYYSLSRVDKNFYVVDNI